MRNILLTLSLLLTFIQSLLAQVYHSPEDIPDPKEYSDGFVSDPDGFLTSSVIDELNEMAENIREAKGFEVAIVVVNSIDGQAVLPFATDLGNLWGVGKGDRGIVILAAIADRNMAIATGYATEEFIPDLVTQDIQQEEIIPYFKLGDYGQGLIEGTKVIEAIVLGEDVPEYVEQAMERHKNIQIWEYIAMVVGGIMIILTIIISPKLNTVLTNLIILVTSVVLSLIAYFWFLNDSHTADVILDSSVILSFIAISINSFIVAKNETNELWPYGVLITCVVGVPISGLYLYGFKGIVLFYLSGAAILFGLFLLTYTISLFIKDPYRKFHLNKIFKLDVFGYIFPFPMYIVDMFVENQLESWRNRVRYSKKTGLEMHKLSEEKDNKYLESGQVAEEKVKSVDYDVWVSGEPEDILILRYTTWFSKYSTCSKCKYKTWYLVYDKTISSATYSSSGTGEKKRACSHCGHQRITRYTIPKLTPPGSSSSSSGGYSSSSSSSGGSWGGGSFGGGGSSSSW